MALATQDIIISTIFTKDTSYLGAYVLSFFQDFTEKNFAVICIDLFDKPLSELLEEITKVGKKLVIIIPKVDWTDDNRINFNMEKYNKFLEFLPTLAKHFKKIYTIDTLKDETRYADDEDTRDARTLLKITANKIVLKTDLDK